MQIFDTHAHYDDDAFCEDRDTLLGGAMAAEGVSIVVNVGASMEGAEASVALAQRYPAPKPADFVPSQAVPSPGIGSCSLSGVKAGRTTVFAACGIHPDDTGIFEGKASSSGIRYSRPEDAMHHLRELCAGEGVVCVGEIGLDYHWMKETKEVQKRWFREQLHLARELDLPVNVHSRDASQDTFDIIRENYDGGGFTGGIIHCYSGSLELAREYVKMGYRIGVGGVVTFQNAKVLKKTVAEIPLEYLVTETDCPYLSPVPYRGKRNDSRNIRYVIEAIAQLKEMDPEACAQALWQNACAVCRIST